jgi:hypothetical protein
MGQILDRVREQVPDELRTRGTNNTEPDFERLSTRPNALA